MCGTLKVFAVGVVLRGEEEEEGLLYWRRWGDMQFYTLRGRNSF
jgi:hypothetical protein